MQLQSSTPITPFAPPLEEPGPNTGTIPAAIYDRASASGGYDYAQETHFDHAVDLMHRAGGYLAMYRWEDEKGGKVARKGYQDILRAARLGQIGMIVVDHLSRLGRRGPERLKALYELDHLKVKVLVVSKQRADEPGIVRYVEAWQDEEYLREQARKTISNMPRVIKAGKHPAPRPIGYRRVYPPLDAYDKKVTSVLVKDDDYGPLVQGVFGDYAEGRSIRDIVYALNSGPLPNPKAKDGRWSYDTIRAMLSRKVYLGLVEWGRKHVGEWGPYQGPVLTEQGQHEALITPELWAKVQERLQRQEGPRRMNQRGATTELLDGVLRCRGCGGRVYATYSTARNGVSRHYTCANRKRMKTTCQEPSISVRLADEAVLQQVARLKGIPWEPQPFDEVVRRDPAEAERRRLRALISADEDALQANATAFRVAGDFSPEAAAAFRKDAQEISLRLRHHKDQLAALPERRVDTVKAKEVHESLMQRNIPAFLADARARGDVEVLRDIVVQTVSAARIVARGSRTGKGRQATWAKAEVDWTPEVQLLLDAGRLVLGPEASPPERTTPQELAKERARRYRARKREQQQG